MPFRLSGVSGWREEFPGCATASLLLTPPPRAAPGTGMECVRQNRQQRARATLREEALLDAGLPHLWYYRGETERLLGNIAEGEAAYRRCLELDAHHGRALAGLERLKKVR